MRRRRRGARRAAAGGDRVFPGTLQSGASTRCGPYLTSGARQAEARFFYLMSQRGCATTSPSNSSSVRSRREFPETTWAEEALNNLATYYIQQDRDDDADVVLREMYARFPRGRHAERAAWKAGWTAYRKGNMGDAVRYFESASRQTSRDPITARRGSTGRAARARRWAIARARSRRTRLTLADYQNTYYGRLAEALLKKHGARAWPEQSGLCADCGAARPRRRRLFSAD